MIPNRPTIEEMKMEVLFDEIFATVSYDAEREMSFLIWHGNPNYEEYQQPFYAILKQARSGKLVKRLMTDTRKQGVISPQMRKWFEADMFPQGVEAGLQRVAMVSDANVFKRYYLHSLIKAVNKFGVPFKIAGDEEEALKFLMAN